MTQWAFPFADNNGDRAYSDSDFSKFFSALFNTGVFMNVGTALQITQSVTPNMRVNIGKGAAIINGRIYFNNDATALNIPIASTIQDRTDSIALQLDLSKRTIEIVYKQSDTSVTRNDTVYELQIATIFVAKNATAITASNITDRRGTSAVCGYASPFQSVPVDGLVNQFTDLLNQFLSGSKQQFVDWFSDIKGKLGDAPATNLQTQIDAIKATNADVTKENTFTKKNKFTEFTEFVGHTNASEIDVFGQLNALSNASVGKNLDVAGDTVTQKIDVNGGFYANSGATVKGDLDVTGDTSVKSLATKTWSFINGGVDINNGLKSNGPTNLNGDTIANKIDVNGKLFTHAGATIYGELVNNDQATFKNGINVNGTTNLNGGELGVTGNAYFNDRVFANNGLSISGDTVTNKIDVNGPILTHGDLQVDGHLNGTNTREVVRMGIGEAIFWRFGHTVLMYMNTYYGDTGYTFPWGYMSGFSVPAGYRPVEKVVVNVINDYKTSHAAIDLGGSLSATNTEYNRNTNIEIQGIWMTNDGFRI